MHTLFNLNQSQARWVEDRLAAMSVEEKLGQMVCETHKRMPPADQIGAFMRDYPIGHVFVGAEIIDRDRDNAERVRAKCDRFRKAAGDRQALLLCGDMEHGAGCVVNSFTRFPNPMALGATNDVELAYAQGQATALEAASFGVHWAFAPVADLNTNLNNPVVNHRGFGDDPDHVLPLLKAMVRGMQAHGMAAGVKHFPGDGTDDRNQHSVTSLNTLSTQQWRHMHGRVFKELIDEGALSIMVGHIGFPAYEPADERGLFRPASVSRALMTDLLRDELGFEGIIVTDALSMAGFCTYAPYEQRMIDSFNGGADVFLWPETARFFEVMTAALGDGRASADRLEESARRVLSFKAHLGLHEENDPKPIAQTTVAEHREAAAAIAQKSVTLLRNRRNLLPLSLKHDDPVLCFKSAHQPDDSERPVDRFAPFFDVFESHGASVTVAPFTARELNALKQRFDEFALVVLLEHVTTVNAAGTVRGLGPIWQFVADPYPNKLFITFGSPYYLHDVASADTYINAYCDSTLSQVAAARAIFGELPFVGTSPVDCAFEFRRGDGIVTAPDRAAGMSSATARRWIAPTNT